MLETSAVEVARRPRYRRPANSERDRRRAKIEQRQDDLQHGLEAGAVVRQLQLRRDFAVVERHRCRGVGPQAETIPRPGDRKPTRAARNEIERRVGRARSLRRQRRDHVAVRLAGAGHKRFFGGDMDSGGVSLRSRHRRPEMAARSGLTERKRRQMPAGGDLFECRRDRGVLAGRGDRRRGADMHQINHRHRRVRFGERADDRGERARPKRSAAHFGRQHDAQKPGGTKRLYRVR